MFYHENIFLSQAKWLKSCQNLFQNIFWTNQSIGKLYQSIGTTFLSQPIDWSIKSIDGRRANQLTNQLW